MRICLNADLPTVTSVRGNPWAAAAAAASCFSFFGLFSFLLFLSLPFVFGKLLRCFRGFRFGGGLGLSVLHDLLSDCDDLSNHGIGHEPRRKRHHDQHGLPRRSHCHQHQIIHGDGKKGRGHEVHVCLDQVGANSRHLALRLLNVFLPGLLGLQHPKTVRLDIKVFLNVGNFTRGINAGADHRKHQYIYWNDQPAIDHPLAGVGSLPEDWRSERLISPTGDSGLLSRLGVLRSRRHTSAHIHQPLQTSLFRCLCFQDAHRRIDHDQSQIGPQADIDNAHNGQGA